MQIRLQTIFKITSILSVLLAIGTVSFSATTAQEQPPDQSTPIRVWWPEALYRENQAATIDNLFAEFDNSNIQIESRIYEMNVDGQSVIAQLNLTQAVAPDAVPDIILMSRTEMLNAVLASSVAVPPNDDMFTILPVELQNIEAWETRVILNQIIPLSSDLVALGEINGTLYGLPYLANIQHMVTTSSEISPPSTIGEMLEADVSILFPGRPVSGQSVNNMVLAIYSSFGGDLIDDNNVPSLDEAALEATLQWLKNAIDSNIITDGLMDYRTPADYTAQILDQSTDIALVTSNQYLNQADLQNLSIFAIPTGTEPMIYVDGWVWVLITQDADRQLDARDFVGWLFETDQLVDVALALNYIPLQERAVNALDDDVYFELMKALFENPIFVSERRNQAAIALQTAFESILNGAEVSEARNAALQLLANDASTTP